jgi:hypothetical protein
MSYVPPEVPLAGVIKKKTKKAFVPGFGGRTADSEDRASSYRYAKSTDETDVITPEPCEPFVADEKPMAKQGRCEPISADVVEQGIQEPTSVAAEPEDLPNHEPTLPGPHVAEERDAVIEHKVTEDPAHEVPVGDEAVTVNKEEVTPINLVSIRGEIQSLTQQLAELRIQKETASDELEAFLNEQTVLCENERFEEAELLDIEIQRVRDDLFDLNSMILESVPTKLRDAKSQLRAMHVTQLDLQRSMLAERKTQLESANAEMDEACQSLSHRLATIEEVDTQFVARDEDLKAKEAILAAKRQEVDSAILAESEKVVADKARAEKESAALEIRIEELQRELAQAMADRSQCAMIISASDLRLSTIRNVEFARDLEELAEMEAEVSAATAALTEEKSVLGGGHFASVELELETLETERVAVLAAAESEVADLTKEVNDWGILVTLDRENSEFYATIDAQLAPLTKTYLEASEYCLFMAETTKSAESQTDTFKSRVAAMKAGLPALEAAKREAVANRSFKEAKELAAELKDITEELEAAEQTLNELKSKARSARADLAAADAVAESALHEWRAAELETSAAISEFEKSRYEKITSLLESISSLDVRSALVIT